MAKLIELETIQDYKYHPRFLELRMSGIYNNLVNEYGRQEATEFIKSLCVLFNVPYETIARVLNSTNKIQNIIQISSTRKKQEMIVMSALWGETRAATASKYLDNISENYIYQNKELHNYKYFATPEWFDKLEDADIIVAGFAGIQNVLINFLKALQVFSDIV